jgi:hypothetical protein
MTTSGQNVEFQAVEGSVDLKREDLSGWYVFLC